MIGICLEGHDERHEYEADEFEARFLEICEEHRRSGRALAFAFLLYDVRNAEMLKVLRDSDYWRALDHLSGAYLTVFSFQAVEPQEDYAVERRGMSGITGAADLGMKNQLILRSYFPLEGHLSLPALLFFQVEGGEIVNYYLWQLTQQRVEDAFIELREAIGIAVKAVEQVAEENRGNAHEIFNLIEQRLKARRLKLRILKGVRALKEVRDAGSLVTMLV